VVVESDAKSLDDVFPDDVDLRSGVEDCQDLAGMVDEDIDLLQR
jgi:hypothetical protein